MSVDFTRTKAADILKLAATRPRLRWLIARTVPLLLDQPKPEPLLIRVRAYRTLLDFAQALPQGNRHGVPKEPTNPNELASLDGTVLSRWARMMLFVDIEKAHEGGDSKALVEYLAIAADYSVSEM